jgi:hypothetical protein
MQSAGRTGLGTVTYKRVTYKMRVKKVVYCTPLLVGLLTRPGEPITASKGVSTGTVKVADFTDTAPDAATYTTSSYTVSINWEDGTTLTSGTINTDGSGGYAVFGTHTYTGQRGSHRMDQFVTNVTPSNKKRRTSGCRLGEWELFECNGALVDIRFFPKIGRKPAIRPLR